MASSDEAEIEALIRGVLDAFANDTPWRIGIVEDPAMTVWDVFRPELIIGAEARAKYRLEDQAQKQSRGKLTMAIEPGMVINTWDNTAVARFYMTFNYEPPNATSGRIRITDVLRRVNGRWRRMHHHEGMVPTGVPSTSEPHP